MRRHTVLLLAAVVAATAAPAAGQAAPADKLPANVPRKGLVAFWTADGHARDSAGKHHGVLRNGVTFTPDRHGTAKGAFHFSDKKGVVNIPDSDALDTDDAFTLAAWINPKHYRGPKDKSGAYSSIIRKYWDSRGGDYILWINSSGLPGLLIANKATGRHVSDYMYVNAAVPKNVWTHMAATFDRGLMKIYVNGRLKKTHTSKLKHTWKDKYTHDGIAIGAYYTDYHYHFDGAIDEVGIWKRALSDVEMAAIAGPLAGVDVTRLALADRLETDDSTVLTGTIQNKKYTLATKFGKIDLPATKVVGIVRWRGPKATTQPDDPQVRVILADGQIVGGSLPGQKISIKTSQGPIATVPIGSLVQCGYCVTNTKPARPVPIGPAITLRDGQRLTISEAGGALQLRTDWGSVPLPPKSLLHLGPTDATGSRHRASFAGGSVVTGTLPKTLKLTLALGLTLRVDRSRLWQISGVAGSVSTGGATILLRNGDRLVGRFGPGTLKVRTKFGDMKVYARGIASMQVGPEKPPRVTVRGWDGTNLAGSFVDAAIAFEIAPGGPTVNVPPSSILSAVNPSPSPPPEMLKKLEKRIAQLGAESYLDREKAQKDLIAMGKSIVPLLKKYLAETRDPEIRQRLQEIIKALGG